MASHRSSTHTATVAWEGGGSVFVDQRYHRGHQWRFDGGAVVAASSSPHVVPAPYSDAAAVDPEEAYVAALASCHMLWFLDMASRAGWRVLGYTDSAVGTMAPDARGRLVVARVVLRPVAVFPAYHAPSVSQLQVLHERAHQECFLANSVQTQIDCEPALQLQGEGALG